MQQVRLREVGKHFESDESRHLGLRSGSKRDSTMPGSLNKDGAYNGEPAPQGNRLQPSRTAVRAPSPNTNSRRTNLQHTRPIPTNKRNSPTRRHGADGKQVHKHTRTRIRRAVWWVVRRVCSIRLFVSTARTAARTCPTCVLDGARCRTSKLKDQTQSTDCRHTLQQEVYPASSKGLSMTDNRACCM